MGVQERNSLLLPLVHLPPSLAVVALLKKDIPRLIPSPPLATAPRSVSPTHSAHHTHMKRAREGSKRVTVGGSAEAHAESLEVWPKRLPNELWVQHILPTYTLRNPRRAKNTCYVQWVDHVLRSLPS